MQEPKNLLAEEKTNGKEIQGKKTWTKEGISSQKTQKTLQKISQKTS